MEKLKLYTQENLDKLRKLGDPLADQAVLDLITHPDIVSLINSYQNFPSESDWSGFPLSVQKYFQSFSRQVEFLDEKKIVLAQEYFSQNGHFYLSMLGFYSLPYCYAFADGAQVLVRSKRITEESGKRLAETALFLLDCFKPGGFLGDDKHALLSIAKVRLIHAFSRYFVGKYATDWQEAWGLPINQEDMIGTNLSFSLLVIRGMEKLKKSTGQNVYLAVFHYWKVIGAYLGLDTRFWPENPKEAFELEKMIRKRHLRPSEAGKILIRSLLSFYEEDIPNPQMAKAAESLVSFFVGNQVSEALDIQQILPLRSEPVRLLLEFNFWKDGNSKMSYSKIRSQFLCRQKEKFPEGLSLSVPLVNRS
ncbi:oxygenase MpaB family protein [Arthrospiribacter ruber]|uniref:DUF2236 domain-containing protein n=1 Tax=Arthrospiribacter ruber TaxID=2487934 RepID=A0A951IY24_9BACT|nr:oxygenase MpaB family protein [Arthrospiribacter ruber]MBW3468457.1 DUF2236 domain-containing protein [Arthrospiribacter ruber]